MKIGAVIVAAGSGERLGAGVPKCFLEIEGVPLWALSTLAFQESSWSSEIVLVVPAGFENRVRESADRWRLDSVRYVTCGGARRQDSVGAGVAQLGDDVAAVLIHDGARPFVSTQLIDRVAAGVERRRAAYAAVPVGDTLHYCDDSDENPPERGRLVSAQTPQGAAVDLLRRAFNWSREKGVSATDEVTLIRRFAGLRAEPIPGEASNVKITRREDWEFFQPQLLQRAERLKMRER